MRRALLEGGPEALLNGALAKEASANGVHA